MKQITVTQLISTFFLFLFLSACTEAEVMGGGQSTDGQPTGEVETIFNLEVADSQSSVTRSITFTTEGSTTVDTLSVGDTPPPADTLQTRSATDLPAAQEKKVAGLWIGQYDNSGNTLLSWQYIESVPVADADQKVKVTAKLAAAANCKVWLVANAGDLGEVLSETALKAKTLTCASTADGKPQSNLLAMTGTWTGNITGTATPQILPDITLTRLSAKITFTYKINGTGFTFTPTSVTLKNVPDRSQVGELTTQLSSDIITYGSYTGTISNKGATIYWYLPENMAGTATGSNAVSSEKEKTGQGVTNATYIELSGNAVQNGVEYKNVAFRFFPGKDANDYNIKRNDHYIMSIDLKGLDVSDQRITVGTIPPITADSEENLPNTGGSKVVNITSRPGVVWSLPLPLWLSATMDGQTIQGGSTLTNQGAGTITFTAGVNQRGEVQTQAYTIPLDKVKSETFTIAQNASSLTVGAGINLTEPTAGATGSSSFTATAGLPWNATFTGDWLAWTSGNPSSGTTAGSPQALKVKSTSANPSAQPRTTSLVVKAGASVNDANYTGLKREINVTQPGSVLTIAPGTPAEIGPEAKSNLSWTFTATPGLSWQANANASWIKTTASGNTSADNIPVPYSVLVNPTKNRRSSTITVRAGDPSTGPSGTITVAQRGAVLNITSGTSVSIGAEARDLPLTFTATPGLSWTASVNGSWISLTGATGGNTPSGSVSVPYRVTVNPNAGQRSGSITVRAGDASGGPAGTVSVMQAGSRFTVVPTSLNVGYEGATASVTVNGTPGLAWTVNPTTTKGITPLTTNGTANGGSQSLSFQASRNMGGERSARFTVSVPAGNHSKTVVITQAADPDATIIDQVLLRRYATAIRGDLTAFPPFDIGGDGGREIRDTHGVSFTLNGTNSTMIGTYAIQVQRTQRSNSENHQAAEAYCNKLNEDGFTDWRLPAQIELYAMWEKAKGADNDATDGDAASEVYGDKFIVSWYWSSSVSNGNNGLRCGLSFLSGSFGSYVTSNVNSVRCVRDLN